MQKRIVITGIGVRSSNAKNYEEFVETLRNTIPGQKQVTLFPTEKLCSQIACQIGEELKYRNTGEERINQIAFEAIDNLFEDQKIRQLIEDNRQDTLLSYATSLSGNEYMLSYTISCFEGNEEKQEYAYIIPSSVTHIAQKLGIKGPVYTTMSACAAGTAAAGIGIEAIRNGEVTFAVIGGADSLSEFSTVGFHTLGALSGEVCKPFDVNRAGINIGEASAFMIFEEYEHALARGANIYAEVVGYSVKNEAYHMTAPHPDGEGAYQVMMDAMKDANIKFSEENIYVNAHGTGTRANDVAEAKAITRVFSNNPNVYLSSTKSLTGHCLGAAGSLELVAAVISLKEQFIPATAHTQEPVELKDNIHLVLKESKETEVDYVVSNSFAFAGNNACIILKRYLEV